MLLLGFLLLALFAGVGRGVRWGAPRPPMTLPERPATTLPPPVPLDQFADVWRKPLFSPDRQPAANAAGGGNLGDLQLTGIILTPGLRMALLHGKGGPEIRLREGSALPDGSWTLVELKPRSALFDSPGGRTELKLPEGAPIDNPHPGDVGKPTMERDDAGETGDIHRDSGPGLSGEPDAAPAASAGQPGTAEMNGGGEGRPHQAVGASQAERLQRLKAAIRKRRAERAGAVNEGDH
jgi:general secretion pathway protein N